VRASGRTEDLLMTEIVEMQINDGIAVITLNVPERRNAISLEMRDTAISPHQ
jgi:enoyl-CoA hydratase/carnithine racemase